MIFFQQTNLGTPLGGILLEARLARGLSLSEAASASRLGEEVILELEEGRTGDARTARLSAVAYARALGLDPAEIRESLPPAPDLAPRDQQFLSNYARPLRPRLNVRAMIQVLAPMGKTVLSLLLVASLLGSWGMIRKLSRVRNMPWTVAHNPTPSYPSE